MFFNEELFISFKHTQQEYQQYYRIYKYVKNNDDFFKDNLFFEDESISAHKYNDVIFIDFKNNNLMILLSKKDKKIIKIIDDLESIDFHIFDYINFNEDSFELIYHLNVDYIKFGNLFNTNNILSTIDLKTKIPVTSNDYSYSINKNNDKIKTNLQTTTGFNLLTEEFKDYLNKNELNIVSISGFDSNSLGIVNFKFKNLNVEGIIEYNINKSEFLEVSLKGHNDLLLFEERGVENVDFYSHMKNIFNDFKTYEGLQYKI